MTSLPSVVPSLSRVGRSLRIASAAVVVATLPVVGGAVVPGAALPTATAAPAETRHQDAQPSSVSQGSFSWGIKQSFRNYLTGPIAGGHWTLDGVGFSGGEKAEDGSFDFTVDPAAAAVQGDDADLPLNGSVTLVGHGGLINVTLSNLVLQVRGTAAQLIADGRYLAADADAVVSMAGGPPAFTASPVATFNLDESLTSSTARAGAAGGTATVSGDSWIHENLNQALLGNYGEGKNDGDRFSLDLTTTPGGGNRVDENVTVARSAGQPEPKPEPEPGAATPAAGRGDGTTAASPTTTVTPQAQATPAGDPGQCGEVTSASAGWGIKQSFRSYLNGPIAMGGWDLKGVDFSGDPRGDGQFDFTADPSAVKISGQDADIPLGGSIHMYGHLGALDITLSKMSVKVRGARAQFIADYRSTTVSSFSPGAQVTGADTGRQVAIAEFTLGQPITAAAAQSGTVDLSGPGYITEEGNKAFGGNYGEGNNEADPLNVSLATSGGDCGTSGEGLGELGTASPAAGGGSASGGAAATGSGNPDLGLTAGAATAAGAAGSADTTCDADDKEANKVVDARMGWGVRESFRSYITGGIANGGWTTGGGAVYSDGAFVFAGSEGTVSAADGSVSEGVLSFTGSVNFSGHGGVLDTTVANPEIRISGSGGSLVADVTSNDTDGNPQDFGRIEVGTLGVTDIDLTDGVLDGGASVTLTQDGSSALGQFYETGAAMDPLTFKAALADGCDGEAAGLDDMPEDEGDENSGDDGDGTGDVTVRDSAGDRGGDGDGGDDENALMAFVTTPASAVPSAIALIALVVAAWFGIRLRRAGTERS